jgi:hypothetical protein
MDASRLCHPGKHFSLGANLMNNNRRLFMTACVFSLGAVGLGLFAAIQWGGETPGWLLRAEVALFSAAALAYGFTLSLPALAPWAWSRPIRGTAYIVLGVFSIFIPVQFVVSAFLIGVGTRLTWMAACDLEDDKGTQAASLSVVLAGTEINPTTGAAGQPLARRLRTRAALNETGSIVNHDDGARARNGTNADD